MRSVKDLTGKKFGRLTVIHRNGCLSKRPAWLCLCDCGTIKTIRGWSLTCGDTKSCGCLHKEIITTHGKSGHPLYRIWQDMRTRCGVTSGGGEKTIKNYIKRNISCCKEWSNFDSFYEWAKGKYRKGLEIDRKNNNGNYTPQNCRFVTHKINNQNKRNSKKWVINGKKYKTAKEAAWDYGVVESTISAWCDGHKNNGKYCPPKNGCYSERLYNESL